MKAYKEMTEGELMIRAGKGDEQARKELNNRRLARIRAFNRDRRL